MQVGEGWGCCVYNIYNTGNHHRTFPSHAPPPNHPGAEGAVVVGKLLETEDEEVGYNAATGVYESMIKAGVIDPVKVVKTALLDAASVASLLTTAECVITDAPEDKKPAPPMGGMGGMDGMY